MAPTPRRVVELQAEFDIEGDSVGHFVVAGSFGLRRWMQVRRRHLLVAVTALLVLPGALLAHSSAASAVSIQHPPGALTPTHTATHTTRRGHPTGVSTSAPSVNSDLRTIFSLPPVSSGLAPKLLIPLPATAAPSTTGAGSASDKAGSAAAVGAGSSEVPPRGHAIAFGCGPALVYLHAYAAPGFALECPGNAGGHQATTTCVNGRTHCSLGGELIVIADPCAAAYMNEASNSWVLLGMSRAPIDPYGYCR